MRLPTRVLGIDPGFGALGWATADVSKRGERPVKMGLLRTKPSKHEADKQHDRVVRLNVFLQGLREVFDGERMGRTLVEWVVCEDITYEITMARSMIDIGQVVGGIVALAQQYGVPVTLVPPNDVKKALLGPATKREKGAPLPDRKFQVEELLRARHSSLPDLLTQVPPSLQSHPIDALAVVRAALLLDTGLRRAVQVQEEGERLRAEQHRDLGPDPQ